MAGEIVQETMKENFTELMTNIKQQIHKFQKKTISVIFFFKRHVQTDVNIR